MKFVEGDTYLCPYCGCMFKREEIKGKTPDYTDAAIERDNICCVSCGNFGMNYQVNCDPPMMFRSTNNNNLNLNEIKKLRYFKEFIFLGYKPEEAEELAERAFIYK